MASTNVDVHHPADASAQATPTDLLLLIFIHGYVL